MKVFAPFRLDAVNQCLWRHGDTGQEERILLTPKAFAVLTHLVEHAGRLISQDELLEAVWPDTVVEPQSVKKHILDVRTALGDRPRLVIDVDPVGAGVLEDVEAVAVMDARMVRRHEALGIRQYPVIVRRSTDIAADAVEHHGTAVAEEPAMITYYAKLQRHRRPRYDKYTLLTVIGRCVDI